MKPICMWMIWQDDGVGFIARTSAHTRGDCLTNFWRDVGVIGDRTHWFKRNGYKCIKVKVGVAK